MKDIKKLFEVDSDELSSLSNAELIELHKMVLSELMHRLHEPVSISTVSDSDTDYEGEIKDETMELKQPEEKITIEVKECEHEWLPIPGTDEEICMKCDLVRNIDK